MADIKLGQLLSFSAGIRGNNPVYIYGTESMIDPVGPDGWYSFVDDYSLGIKDGKMGNVPFTTKSLWCEPGGGYSYASASIHDASIMLRFVTGTELEDYISTHLARPLGWGRWGFGYKNQPLVTHTPGAGGIALRSTDMLRFLYLLINKGRWGQEQLIPEEYIEKATRLSSYNPHYPYSLQFNVNSDGYVSELPGDAFWKFGSGGHCFCVIPSLDLIIWKPGGRNGQYSSNDTGLPEPVYSSDLIQPINDGQLHNAESDNIKMMIMVINSIVQ
jgi:CubicO group peptidase (beta-lactamase class C family)